jgi:hypothetical protein
MWKGCAYANASRNAIFAATDIGELLRLTKIRPQA